MEVCTPPFTILVSVLFVEYFNNFLRFLVFCFLMPCCKACVNICKRCCIDTCIDIHTVLNHVCDVLNSPIDSLIKTYQL